MAACWRSFVLVTVVVSSYADLSRNVSSTVNPNCTNICNSLNYNQTLVYVRAPAINPPAGQWNEMDYLWSTIGCPTIVTSNTNENKDIEVDWSNDATKPINNIRLNSDFSQALILSDIFTFTNTTLNLTEGGGTVNKTASGAKNFSIDWMQMKWDKFDADSDTFYGTYPIPNGTLWLELKCFAASGKGEQGDFPHLPFSGNTTVIEVRLYLDVPATRKDHDSVALELFVVPKPTMGNHDVKLQHKRTLDDEYTPSVFHSYTIEVGGNNGGFMQWKPIVYTTEGKKTVEDSELVYVQPNALKPLNKSRLPHSIAHLLYEESAGESAYVNASVFYIVFHPSSSAETNPTFFSWTITLGHGAAPTQGFSLLVILTIALGLGIPGGVTVLGSIYVVYKKRQMSKMQTSGYSPVN